MAKPDMPYGLFPWVVPNGSPTGGSLSVDLATAMKWYWRVKSWTTYFYASFSVLATMSDGSTIRASCGMSALETWNVLADGLDELSLTLSYEGPPGVNPYTWIRQGSPTVGGGITIIDSSGVMYPAPGDPVPTVGFTVGPYADPRTLFAPGRPSSVYSDGYPHMIRNATSGQLTPFLGSGGPPIWQGGSWGTLGTGAENRVIVALSANVGPTPAEPNGVDGLIHSGNVSVTLAANIDGHSFGGTAFVNWAITGYSGEDSGRAVDSVTYEGDGAISLTITPVAYWTYAPRSDPSHPTYDAGTGAIVNNPATGAPWTIQEIISRQGP